MEKVIIICTDIESELTFEISIKQAYYKLTGYWQPDKIIPMLLEGIELFTPYEKYKIK